MAYAEKLEACPKCGCDGRQWRYDRQKCLACGHDGISQPVPAEPGKPPEEIDEEHPLVETVARAIAVNGVGRPWDDFKPVNAFDMDQGDLKQYALAAIHSLSKAAEPRPALPTPSVHQIVAAMKVRTVGYDCGVDVSSLYESAERILALLQPDAGEKTGGER